MIGFMIREMELQEMQFIIDGIGQSEMIDQSMKGSNATRTDASGSIRDFEMNVRGREHFPSFRGGGLFESPLDPPLGVSQFTLDPALAFRAHSKVLQRKMSFH